MSAMERADGFPDRPADVPLGVGLPALATQQLGHEARLVDARHGIGDPLPAEELAGHALAALAVAHAVAERVLWSRWSNVRDALTFGASVEAVAGACGLTVEEVRAGLTRWADGQLRERYLNGAEHAAVLALIGGAW